jgi:hypothetical protein
MSFTRVALVAAAVGSAVAALLTVAFLKLTRTEPPASAAAPADDAQPSSRTAAQPAEDTYVPPPPASEEEQEAPAPEEESPRALKAVQPRAETPTGPKASGPRASSVTAKSSASRKESGARASAQAAKATPRREASSAPAPIPADPADIQARYEKGDVDGALSLARGAQLEPIATKLASFQSAQASGMRALKAQDTASAIQYFTVAVAVDQELSQGWSVQGRNLRKQLGRLYTQTGQQQVKSGDKSAARESFELALKYDPANSGAKAELQQLGGKR